MDTKDKVIAGAVGGGLGAAALLGGLIGGLLTTTAMPDVPAAVPTLSPTRFLEHGDPAAVSSANHGVLSKHVGSLWPWAAAAFGAISVAATVAGFKVQDGSRGARTPRHGKLSDASPGAAETDEESSNETPASAPRAAPDAFDQLDANHDGVITRDEFEAAVHRGTLVGAHVRVPTYHTVITAPPVYVTPLAGVSITPRSGAVFSLPTSP
jgi:hypothetical protein